VTKCRDAEVVTGQRGYIWGFTGSDLSHSRTGERVLVSVEQESGWAQEPVQTCCWKRDLLSWPVALVITI